MDHIVLKKLDDYLRGEYLAGRITVERLREIAEDTTMPMEELVKKYPELTQLAKT